MILSQSPLVRTISSDLVHSILGGQSESQQFIRGEFIFKFQTQQIHLLLKRLKMFTMFPHLPGTLSRNRLKPHSKNFQPLGNIQTTHETLFIISQQTGSWKISQPTSRKRPTEIIRGNIPKGTILTGFDDDRNMIIRSLIHQTQPNSIHRFTSSIEGFLGSMPPESIHGNTFPFVVFLHDSRWTCWCSPASLQTGCAFEILSHPKCSFIRASIPEHPDHGFLVRMTQIAMYDFQFLVDFSILILFMLFLISFHGMISFNMSFIFHKNIIRILKVRKNRRHGFVVFHKSLGKTSTQKTWINCGPRRETSFDLPMCPRSMIADKIQSPFYTRMSGEPTPWFLDQ